MKLQVRSIPQNIPVQDSETQLEPLVRIIIHNDEVTPMDFVVHVLQSIFKLDSMQAQQVMITAHNKGMALVQILPKNEAIKRVSKAHFAAGLEGYPLYFTIEEE